MNKILALAIGIVILFSVACSKNEAELTSSVFIPDQEISDLPAYTEWGYNTFGAVFDREYFLYTNSKIPLKILSHNKNTKFIFDGELGYDDFKLVFSIDSLMPMNYIDLLNLNDSVFDLANNNCNVLYIDKNDTTVVDVLSGEFHIKRAQKLYIDDVQKEVIISGYFDFKYLVDSYPYSVNNGRFDISVGDNVFFYYW